MNVDNSDDTELKTSGNMEEDQEKILQNQLMLLESENRKMQNEFNAQRAKMKELFLQKENEHAKCRESLQTELDDLKSQFVVAKLKAENDIRKAQEEISSLQRLVQDTIEESVTCKAELNRIKRESEESVALTRETRSLKDVSNSLAPQVLSHVKKTIARTLGGESSTGNINHENDDRSKTNQKLYAQEDPEVLGNLVEQLQEEMKALKEKLREADYKIQATSTIVVNDVIKNSDISSVEIPTDSCNTCAKCVQKDEEIKLLVAKDTNCKSEMESLNGRLGEMRTELEKEMALRKDLDEQWHERREYHKQEVHCLREQIRKNEKELQEMQQTFLLVKEDVIRQLRNVTDERERIHKHLETLQADNDFLSGRYLATAEEIESQYINLPTTVEELHELILTQQNELIQARIGNEFEKKALVTSSDEIKLLRDQLNSCNIEHRAYKDRAQKEMKSLQNRLTEHLVTLQNYESNKTASERKESDLNRQISELRVEIIELQESNEKMNKANMDFKAKIKNLQDDLITSEAVQKDFVTLSQTLQMSLEELRHADTEVRWQDDEDIDNCPTCKTCFTVTVRKIHCRHCGHIYCDKCLTKTVPSGPRKRNARVCDICHTLLTPNKAPYFSDETPESK